jgi:hypothetical protein
MSSKGGSVRVLLSAAMLLGLGACVPEHNWSPWNPLIGAGPGQLALTNYRFERASVQAVVTTAPLCEAVDPSMPATLFELPFKGTRVLAAAPGADICWRRVVPGGQWSGWNRAFTASGRSIDSQL